MKEKITCMLNNIDCHILPAEYTLGTSIEVIGVREVVTIIDMVMAKINASVGKRKLEVELAFNQNKYDLEAIILAKTLLIKNGYKVTINTRNTSGLYSMSNNFITYLKVTWVE